MLVSFDRYYLFFDAEGLFWAALDCASDLVLEIFGDFFGVDVEDIFFVELKDI